MTDNGKVMTLKLSCPSRSINSNQDAPAWAISIVYLRKIHNVPLSMRNEEVAMLSQTIVKKSFLDQKRVMILKKHYCTSPYSEMTMMLKKDSPIP